MDDKFTPLRRLAERRGRSSETIAAWYLRAKLYRILGRRVRTHVGEIDVVARSPTGILCFIEVKARRDASLAREALLPRQQARIARAAELFVAARPMLARLPIRFDIVIICPRALPRHFRDAWRPGDCG
jgi:putative endonuclease